MANSPYHSVGEGKIIGELANANECKHEMVADRIKKGLGDTYGS